MVDERRGSPEWVRIQAKLRCSLPSANVVRVQRVQNHKLWAAFVGPVTEFRDAGGYVRVDHDSSGVREVYLFLKHIAIVYQHVPHASQHHALQFLTVYTPFSWCEMALWSQWWCCSIKA